MISIIFEMFEVTYSYCITLAKQCKCLYEHFLELKRFENFRLYIYSTAQTQRRLTRVQVF